MTATSNAHAPGDQAHSPVFRGLLLVQVLATTVFGLVPLLLPGVFASVTGYTGDDELVYRLAGAGTTGYFVAAMVALRWRSSWRELRLALIATLSFTAIAAVACAWTFLEGDRHWVVPVVFGAATLFAVLAVYWLRADRGTEVGIERPIGIGWLVVIALATISAAVFGLAGVLAPAVLAPIAGLEGTDVWIFRMSGAACFGYAPAGLLSLRIADYTRIRVQNLAAVGFNATAAVAAWMAWLGGQGGLVAPVVAVAATLFAIALLALDRSYASAR
jgi:hypothetical protein